MIRWYYSSLDDLVFILFYFILFHFHLNFTIKSPFLPLIIFVNSTKTKLHPLEKMSSPVAGSIVPRIRLHLEMDWQLSRDWLHLLKWNFKSLRVGVPIFPPLIKENQRIEVEIKKQLKNPPIVSLEEREWFIESHLSH